MVRKWLAFLGIAIAAFPIFAFNKIPALENPITDTAKIMSEETESQLNEYLKAVNEQTGVQVAVLTVPTLDGESIESFSMRVCEAWKLGGKGYDNGVLLTVALEERKIRIEVGYGLEGSLTDMKCGQIIRNEIAPRFQNGSYSSGIADGVLAIVNIATDGAEIEGDVMKKNHKSSGFSAALIPLIVWFVFFSFIVLQGSGLLPFLICLMMGRPYQRRPRVHFSSGDSDDSFGDSSFGGGFSSGGGGGGFSGGGGGFGGGGASGGW